MSEVPLQQRPVLPFLPVRATPSRVLRPLRCGDSSDDKDTSPIRNRPPLYDPPMILARDLR